MFCTAFVGILDLETGNLQYSNAGHNPPFIIKPDGSTFMLPVKPNLAMGLWQGFEYQDQECQIEKGTKIFLYTDGVNEAENIDKVLFGEDKMLEILSKQKTRNTQEVIEMMLNEIKCHTDGAEQNDDITMLCCSYLLDDNDDTSKELVMRNNIADIALMSEFVENLCDENQLPMDVCFNLNLALEEAVSNVIKYAYPENEEHEIILKVNKKDNGFIFELTDTGTPFDPTKKEDADVTLSAEERPIGGLGIFLIKKIMRAVEYKRVDDKNILIMKYMKE
jgi:sigma-B regulation protein RsbU (phosphoserine phosphatase)